MVVLLSIARKGIYGFMWLGSGLYGDTSPDTVAAHNFPHSWRHVGGVPATVLGVARS